jgi:hypothetical protein
MRGFLCYYWRVRKTCLSLCCLSISIFCSSEILYAQKTTKVNAKSNCRPVQFTLYVNGPSDAQTSFWFYDAQGRIVKDSSFYQVQYFEYGGDSVLSFTRFVDSEREWRPEGNDTIIIKLDKRGVAVSELRPYGVRYQIYYSADGNVDKMEIVQPTINKSGLLDKFVTTCDSIVYSAGNIISYRVINADNPYLPKLLKKFTVKCDYYDKEISSMEFYPLGKLRGLSENPMQTLGSFNVSLFSKNLISKMESPYDSVEFTFQFDEDGRVVSFDRRFGSVSGSLNYDYRNLNREDVDHNLIRYECK